MTTECKPDALGDLWTSHRMEQGQCRRQNGEKEKEAAAERRHSAPTFTKQPDQTLSEAELSENVQLHLSRESLFL